MGGRGGEGVGGRMVKGLGSDLAISDDQCSLNIFHISCDLVLPRLVLSMPFTLFIACEMR
jgi:hypothetical protein